MSRLIWRRTVVGGLALAMVTIAGAQPAAAIIGGNIVVSGGIDPLPAVVKLYGDAHDRFNNERDVNCTGTLITSRWVLTAQHCTNKDEKQGDPFAAGDVKISFRKGPSNPAFDRKPDSIIRMPNYSQTPGGDDIALLHLASPVTDVAAIPLLDGAAFYGVGQIERYGFGQTSAGGGPSADVRRATEGVFSPGAVQASWPPCPQAPYGCWYPDNSLWTYDLGRGRSADGDSGGPVLVKLVSGEYAVAGVTHGSSNNERYVGLSNRVDTASRAWNFIRAHVNDTRVIGPRYLDGTLLKEASTVWVYVIYGGAKFRIPDAAAFNALGYNWSSIRTVADGALGGIPWIPMNGTVLREYSTPTVYRVDDGRKRAIALAEYQTNDYGPFLHYVPNGGLAQIPNA